MYALALPHPTLAARHRRRTGAGAGHAGPRRRARRPLSRLRRADAARDARGCAQRHVRRLRERARGAAADAAAAHLAPREIELTRTLGVIGVPSSAGAYAPGQEKAPRALRDAGLLVALAAAGIEVVDHGDAEVWRWRPDRERPVRPEPRCRRGVRCEHGRARARGARRRRVRARARRRLHRRPRHGGRAPAGRAAGSGSSTSTCTAISTRRAASATARSTGWASRTCSATRRPTPELREFGPRTPLLEDDQIVFLAHRPRAEHGGASSRRSRVAGSSRFRSRRSPPIPPRPPARRWRCSPRATGWPCISTSTASTSPMHRCRRTPGATSASRQDAAFAALSAVLLDSRVSALTITELNPDHGAEDGSTLDRVRRPARGRARRRARDWLPNWAAEAPCRPRRRSRSRSAGLAR